MQARYSIVDAEGRVVTSDVSPDVKLAEGQALVVMKKPREIPLREHAAKLADLEARLVVLESLLNPSDGR